MYQVRLALFQETLELEELAFWLEEEDVFLLELETFWLEELAFCELEEETFWLLDETFCEEELTACPPQTPTFS